MTSAGEAVLPVGEVAASQEVAPSQEVAAHWSVYRGDAIRRRILAIADLLAAATAIILATKFLGLGRLAMLALVPLIVPVGKAVGIYERDELVIRKGTLEEAFVIFQLATLYALFVWLVDGFLFPGSNNRRELLVLWGSLFVSVIAFRTLARHVSRALTPPERCLLLGDALTCGRMEEKLASRSALHAEVIAHIPLSDVLLDGGVSNGAGHQELQPLVSRLQVDRIILMPERADRDEVLDLIRAASLIDVKVSVLPRLFEVVGSSVEFDDVDGVTLLSVPRLRLSRSSRVLKRVFDLAGAFIASVLLAPAMVLIAVAIKLDSRGPALFRQRRVGQHGETFEMFKFRTMVPEADQRKDDLRHLNEANGLFKILNDPRITRVGALLRRTCLDELPQLWNVIRGDMSLVGPRPLVLEEDSRIAGWQRRRLDLTPGMTGQWQILGSARIPLDEMVKLDYLYVTNWTLWLDVKILLRTLPYMVARRGM